MEIKIKMSSYNERKIERKLVRPDEHELNYAPLPHEPLIPQEDRLLKSMFKNEGKATESSVIDELDLLIGLKEIKSLIYEVRAYTEIQKMRIKEQLSAEPTVLHAIFKGNPGSGKTTIARLLARLYQEMGILEKGHLIEVERADLVGEYIGHTAQKTRDQVKKALGGVLFIDEAYSLCRGGEKDFGLEAIDTLVKAMEDHKSEFILILAGYNDEMDNFIRSNPGLNSRFPLHIQFPDYNLNELIAIAQLMYGQREYILAPGAKERLEEYLRNILAEIPQNHGNARTVRNIVEASLRCQAVRLYRNKQNSSGVVYEKAELSTINPFDIDQAVGKISNSLKQHKISEKKKEEERLKEQLRENLLSLAR